MRARERLAAALVAAGASEVMIKRARAGYYGEVMQLVVDARAEGLQRIVADAMAGAFKGE